MDDRTAKGSNDEVGTGDGSTGQGAECGCVGREVWGWGMYGVKRDAVCLTVEPSTLTPSHTLHTSSTPPNLCASGSTTCTIAPSASPSVIPGSAHGRFTVKPSAVPMTAESPLTSLG
eukprot:238930-Chlamydomonas_euryale.AAC.1